MQSVWKSLQCLDVALIVFTFFFIKKILFTDGPYVIERSLNCNDTLGVFLLYILWGTSYILALRALYCSVIDSNDVLVADNETDERRRYLYDSYKPTFTPNLYFK